MKKNPVSKSAPGAATVKTSAYHHGNLRETLLLAADGVLAERGAQGLTLRDVAKAAGVSHAAPYHHFASLNDLLAVVAGRAFITLGDAIEHAASAEDPKERLLQVAEAYVACARAKPAHFRLMFGPLLAQKNDYPLLKAAATRAFAALLAVACAYDAENGAELALCGWSLSHGMSNLIIDGALDELPVPVGDPAVLVRVLVKRALGLS